MFGKKIQKQQLQAPSFGRIISVKKINPNDDLETKIGNEVINMFSTKAIFHSSYLVVSELLNGRAERDEELANLYIAIVSAQLANNFSATDSATDSPIGSATKKVLEPLLFADKFNERLHQMLLGFYHSSQEYTAALKQSGKKDKADMRNYKGTLCAMATVIAASSLQSGITIPCPKIDYTQTFAQNIGKNIIKILESGELSPLFQQVKSLVYNNIDPQNPYYEQTTRGLYTANVYCALLSYSRKDYLQKLREDITELYALGSKEYRSHENLMVILNSTLNFIMGKLS